MRELLRSIARNNMKDLGMERLNKPPEKGAMLGKQKSKFALNWRKFVFVGAAK
jgi:hypothetical protein